MGIGMGKGKGVGMGSGLGLGMGMATGPLTLPQPPAEPPVSAGCSLSLLTDPSFLTAPHTRSPPLYFLTNPQSLTDSMFPNSSPFLVGMGNVGMGRAKIVAVGWNEDKKLLTGGCGRGFGNQIPSMGLGHKTLFVGIWGVWGKKPSRGIWGEQNPIHEGLWGLETKSHPWGFVG